jgi:hypothetical protein
VRLAGIEDAAASGCIRAIIARLGEAGRGVAYAADLAQVEVELVRENELAVKPI